MLIFNVRLFYRQCSSALLKKYLCVLKDKHYLDSTESLVAWYKDHQAVGKGDKQMGTSQ